MLLNPQKAHTIITSRPYGAGPSEWTYWSFGDNENGQLGYETDRFENFEMRQIETDATLNVIATKSNFNIALDIDGGVWGWGDNSSGVFSHVSTEQTVSKPLKLFEPGYFPSQPVQVCCTKTACLLLTEDGSLFAWGTGHLGSRL